MGPWEDYAPGGSGKPPWEDYSAQASAEPVTNADEPNPSASGVVSQPEPAPGLMSDERLGKAVDYLQMLNPRNIPAAAEQAYGGVKRLVSGEQKPGETAKYPRVVAATDIERGALGTVGPPLIAAGAAAAALPTAVGLGVGMGAQYLTRKTLNAFGANPEISELASDAAGLIAGGKAGHALAPEAPYVPAPEYPNPRGVTPESFYTRRTPQGQVYNDLPAIGEETAAEVNRRQPSATPVTPSVAPELRLPVKDTFTGKTMPVLRPQAPPVFTPSEPQAAPTEAPPPTTATEPPPVQPAPPAEAYPGASGKVASDIADLEAKLGQLDPDALKNIQQASLEDQHPASPQDHRDALAAMVRTAEAKAAIDFQPEEPEEPTMAAPPAPETAPDSTPSVTALGRGMAELGRTQEATDAEMEATRQRLAEIEQQKPQLEQQATALERRMRDVGAPAGMENRRAPLPPAENVPRGTNGEPAPGSVGRMDIANPSPATEIQPGEVGKLPTGIINRDPARFQFKMGVDEEGTHGELKGRTYDRNLAGTIGVWKDPQAGKWYVVEGHNRDALARAAGAPEQNVIRIPGATAEEARSNGALMNIAEGHGTPLDVGKFLRDTGMGVDELANHGITASGKLARQGIALSKLDQGIFDQIALGRIPESRGIAIGESLDTPDQQWAVLDLINEAEKRGKKVTDATVAEAIRRAKLAGKIDTTQIDLFGTTARSRSTALDTSELSADLRSRISKDKRLFSYASDAERAGKLADAGANTLDLKANKKAATAATQAQDAYDRLSGYAGPINDILESAAQRIAAGEDANAVRSEAYSKVREAIQKTIGGAEEAPSRPGVPAPLPGSEPAQAKGQLDLAEQAAEKHLIKPSGGQSTLYFGGLDPAAMGSAVKSLGEMVKGEGSENLSTGTQAKGIIRQETGGLARSKEQLFNDLGPLIKQGDKLTPEQSLDFIGRMESGKPQADLNSSRVANLLRKLLDNRRQAVQDLGTGKLQNFIENYFPHVWEDPNKATDVMRRVLGGKSPLQGPASFLKERSIPTTAEGIAAGLKPVTYNPVTLTLLKVAEMDRYIMAHKMLNGFKEEGLAKYIPFGAKAPEGWVPLDDRTFTVYGNPEVKVKVGDQTVAKSVGGMVIRGRYYAPADAAEAMNRFTSPGLMGSPTYRGLRAYGNALNQMQLGASAFHLVFTGMDAITSDVGLAAQRLSRGEFGRALAPMGRAATLTSPIFSYLKGNAMLKEYLKPGSYQDLSRTADAVSTAGGRAFQDPFYRNGSAQAFQRAWKGAVDAAKAGEVGKTITEGGLALRRSFGALAETMNKPIMENVVPRQKLGVFANMADDVLRRNPDATPAQLRYELNKAWDSVDNRMGQLVYDNLFWNKTVKDLGLISVRSLGWGIGTVRELGGAALDTGKQLGRAAAGLRPEVTSRMAYAIGLPAATAYIGAITTYLATGHGPRNLIDYFYPPNGGTQPDGKPSRWSLPSYVRDVYGFAQNPVATAAHKLHPAVEQVYEMLNNADFYGTEIRHPGDPLVKQAGQIASYLANSFKPFSVRNVEMARKELQSPGKSAAGFFGFTPSPYYVGQTDAERIASEVGARQAEQGPRTQAEFDKSQQNRLLRNRLATGDMTSAQLEDQVRSGQLPRMEAQNIERQAKEKPLVRQFKSMQIEDALRVYEAGTDDEQKTLRIPMVLKLRNAIRNGTPADRERYEQKLREVGSGRTAAAPVESFTEQPALQ